MSQYDRVKGLGESDFRRLTGVKPKTFEKMVEVLTKAFARKKQHGGRPNKLCIEDMLPMTLEYLREYRPYFHIGRSYGLSESNACKGIEWVEDCLVKDKAFSLPGRKALLKSDAEYEVVLIDATETPIERPKKNKSIGIRARKSATP